MTEAKQSPVEIVLIIAQGLIRAQWEGLLADSTDLSLGGAVAAVVAAAGAHPPPRPRAAHCTASI